MEKESKNIKMSFPKFVIGNLHRLDSTRWRSPIETLGDDGVLYNDNNKAFTLIELLVVVLIIGILASVALPQYKMAVAKSRMSGLLTTVKSVLQAEETYYLANGQYTQNWDELALDVPGTPNPTHKQIKEFPNGYIGLNSNVGILAGSTLVPGVQIYAFYEHCSVVSFRRKMSCYAKMGNDFANKVCQALTHKKTPSSDNGPGTDNIYHF